MYGNYEKGITESRFVLYLISLIVLLLVMLKRIYFGGFSKYLFLMISLICSFVFIFINFIYLIFTIVLIFLTIFTLSAYYNIYNNSKEDLFQAKLFLQFFLNIAIFGILIKIFIDSIKLANFLNQIRKEIYNINNNITPEKQEIKIGFEYTGLGEIDKLHYLNELLIEGHPRSLYYQLNKETNPVTKNSKILNINNDNSNNKTIDLNQDNNTILVQNNENKNSNVIVYQNSDKNIIPSQKINSKKNSYINPDGKLDEKKIKNDNIILKSENMKLKEELERLEKQLNLIFNNNS